MDVNFNMYLILISSVSNILYFFHHSTTSSQPTPTTFKPLSSMATSEIVSIPNSQPTPRSISTPRSQPTPWYPLYSSLIFHHSQARISIATKHHAQPRLPLSSGLTWSITQPSNVTSTIGNKTATFHSLVLSGNQNSLTWGGQLLSISSHCVGLYRNVRIIWLGSSSRNNKSKEVKLSIYPLSDCQGLYIIQVHLNIYLHFFISKIIIKN